MSESALIDERYFWDSVTKVIAISAQKDIIFVLRKSLMKGNWDATTTMAAALLNNDLIKVYDVMDPASVDDNI